MWSCTEPCYRGSIRLQALDFLCSYSRVAVWFLTYVGPQRCRDRRQQGSDPYSSAKTAASLSHDVCECARPTTPDAQFDTYTSISAGWLLGSSINNVLASAQMVWWCDGLQIQSEAPLNCSQTHLDNIKHVNDIHEWSHQDLVSGEASRNSWRRCQPLEANIS